MKPINHLALPWLLVAMSALSVGCAGPGPKPDSELQAAESSVQQAESADARKFEPVLLNRAQNKVADARELIDREEYRKAERMLEQAAVDAQLAAARSETEKARRAVAEINRSIDELQDQLESNES